MTRGALAACAVALCAAVTSCASLPTSGSVPIRTLQGNGVQGQTGVQVDPVPPGRGWTPKQIVLGYLAASASFGRHHGVARDYLSHAFARGTCQRQRTKRGTTTRPKKGCIHRWSPGWGATVVDSPKFSLTAIPHDVVTGGPQRAGVTVGGQRFSTLVTAGQDQAGSVVVAPASTEFHFSLVFQDGEWRIDSVDESVPGKPSTPAPRSLLLLTRPDFERDYLPRNIYYFSANSATPVLVPDPVYIPQTGLVTEVRGLVSALLQPRCTARQLRAAGACPVNPSDSSWLYGGAVSAFSRGIRPVRPVQVIGGVTAIVDLGNTAAKTSLAQRRRMTAQLVWSLTAAPYGSQSGQIRTVEVQFGGQSVNASLQTAWVPRGQSSPLYYQLAGSQVQPTQVVIRVPRTAPYTQTLPRQVGNRRLTSMAVSPAPVGSQVLAGCSGRTLYLILPNKVQDAVTRRLPSSCMSLSWDKSANLWITAASGIFELTDAGGSTPTSSALVPVQIPSIRQPSVRPVKALRVAPDGVRVAMIVPNGPTSKIMIAAISHNSTSTYIAQTLGTLRVGSDLADPVALSWLDPDHLLVLNESAPGHAEIYEVPLNGGTSTEISAPGGVTSLSAAWPKPGLPPRVVIGIGAAGSPDARVEQSRGSLINPDWQTVGPGITPVLPG